MTEALFVLTRVVGLAVGEGEEAPVGDDGDGDDMGDGDPIDRCGDPSSLVSLLLLLFLFLSM